MRYLYLCDDCHIEPITVIKPMSEVSNIEICTCGNVMRRVYNSANIKTGDGIKDAKR